MNKDSIVDYAGCILIKLLGALIRSLPQSAALFLGRRLGELLYSFDLKHKSIAYSNIKTALGDKLSACQLSNLTKEFYRSFGQNLIEIFFIPLISKKYLNKYVSIEGLEHVRDGLSRGKGVILLGMHVGSWELSNIIFAKLDFPFVLFVRDQRFPRINRLLNFYRSQKGCKLIQRENQTRQLIEALKDNQAIGMTVDQGGKRGTLVKFFGKDASMASGAVKLALKYDTTIIPGCYTRIKGPYIKIFFEPPFQIKKTQDFDKDVRDNLNRLIPIFEKYILKYPKEYLWSYKVWKYSNEKKILILSDGKAGHLRQAQAVANIASDCLREKGINAKIDTREVEFKSKLTKYALTFSSGLAGKYHCQGCTWCLRKFLKQDSYKVLISIKPDIVISCGSSVVPINFVISRENLAKSIVIMRPSILSANRFDLVIMPKHDNPVKRKNIVITEGALNTIAEQYLKNQSEKLMQGQGLRSKVQGFYIGVLIGGDTKNFVLSTNTILEVTRQIKSVSEKLDADILVTTSRRTSIAIERLVKEEFKGYSRCKLLIIANEKNIPEAVGGILGLSRIIVTSPESITMISEAVSSKKYVLVFKSAGLSKKHQRFLKHFVINKYVFLNEPGSLSKAIEDIWSNKPKIHTPGDHLLIREAISKIL